MDFYVIPPNKHLPLMNNGDRYFALAHHYLQNTNYREHFLQLRKKTPRVWITLDNGSAEHSLVTEQALLDIVKELKPDEVIAPDVLFDKSQTLENLNKFIIKMIDSDSIKHTNIFGCPQGKTKEEWLECYIRMLENPLVSVIGLSKIAVPRCWNNAVGDKDIAKSRNECVKELKDLNLLKKPLHLLGMGEHNEFDYYLENEISNIRSSDSCYTVLAAINGISFEKGDTTRIPTTNEYFDKELTLNQIQLSKKNIDYLKRTYNNI
jgi:hypothetical protein